VSSAASTVRVVSSRRALSLHADAAALAGLVAVMAALVALGWGTWGDLGRDTGYDFSAAARVAQGDIPYADFVYYYGPLAPGLLGTLFWLFGTSTGPALAFGILLAVAIGLATYALVRTQIQVLGSFLAASITTSVALAPTNLSFVVPHSYSAPLAVLLTLCLLLALSKHAHSPRGPWLGAAGTCLGLLTLTRPEFLLAAVAATLAWLGVRALSREVRWRDVALLAGPAAAVPALVYGTLLTTVTPRELVFENLYPVDELDAAGNALLKLRAPLTLSSFAELAGRMALYVLGVAVLVLAGRALGRRLGARVLAVSLVIGTAVAVVAVVVRPETLRYWLQDVYGWIPLGAVAFILYLLFRHRTRKVRWSADQQIALAVTVVLAVLAAKVYAAFFIHSTRPQHAVYAVPFAAVFIARLHLVELSRWRNAAALGAGWLAFLATAAFGLTVHDARAESVSVHGSGGALSALPAEGRAYQRVLSWIERNTPSGTPIFVAPQLTWLYTLSERPSAVPQLSLLPGALVDPEDQRAVISRLERADVRVAVIDRRRYVEYGHTSFGRSFGVQVDRWLRRNFARVMAVSPAGDQDRQVEIWRRRTQ
jgi:hypothetical protein